MHSFHHVIGRVLLTVAATTSVSSSLHAQTRAEITINDTGVMAENLTSSQDGTVYFGSTAKGTIYRAAPGAAQAEPWILASAAGLSNVLGLLADDKNNTLWVCQNNTGGRGGPEVGQTALRSFDLKSGAANGTYPFPSNGGVCNDMAIAPDGTVYATESFANRIHRLKPGATALDLWVPADPQLAGVDGIAVLADGAVYVWTQCTSTNAPACSAFVRSAGDRFRNTLPANWRAFFSSCVMLAVSFFANPCRNTWRPPIRAESRVRYPPLLPPPGRATRFL